MKLDEFSWTKFLLKICKFVFLYYINSAILATKLQLHVKSISPRGIKN